MNLRVCKQCGKTVDFDDPWCEHETMEESAWIDIRERVRNTLIDDMLKKVVKELKWERINVKPPTTSGS